jgi:citrate lyase subunit beta/citryl-CoA lyase
LEDGSASNDLLSVIEDINNAINSKENYFNKLGVRLLNFYHPEWLASTEKIIKESGDKIAYFTLPKISNYIELLAIDTSIKRFLKKYNIQQAIPYHVLIECQSVLKFIDQIAEFKDVECLDFGIMDYVSDLNSAIPLSATHSPLQFSNQQIINIKQLIAFTAIAHGCVASHNVTIEFKDSNKTFEDAKTAYQIFGFSRMWSIHPDQIDPIINAFKPDTDLIAKASSIILEAHGKNWAPLAYQGVLYDRASYRYLWLIIKKARLLGLNIDPQVIEKFLD